MRKSILIIGAGFSGTLTAVHLLRGASVHAIDVTLVNRGTLSARGVAYGTRTPAHVLNVPAGRMSAFPDDEGHFLRFAQERDYSISGASFVPRAFYGDYLEALLGQADAVAGARDHPGRLSRRVGDVVDLVISEHDGRAEAVFADGERCWFDRVVLAIGNYPPADPQIRDPQALRCDAYIQDPWKQNAMQRVDLERAVLLLGSGLTTMDMALDLYQRGMRAPMIVLSRRGLLPIAHRQATAPPSFSHQPPGIDAEPATVLGYLRAVRSHVRRLAPQGIDWREVVASLRPITPRMWLLLPPPERARFLRHLRPFWEVHRHRAAPLPHSAFMRLIEQSALRVVAGRLLNLARIPAGFVAHIARRGSSAPLELEVGTVVNCTGPCTDITRLDDVLMRNLLRRGYVRADPLRLGMEVSSELAPLDAAGRSTRVLFYVGPLLRADYWEATAVPELRLHAASVAKVIAESLA